MRRSIRTSYTHTILASYLGYITQAVVNNFAPLLFLTFRSQMGLTLEQITLLTTLNFSIQLLVDFLSVKVVDRIGYPTVHVWWRRTCFRRRACLPLPSCPSCWATPMRG